MSENTPKLPRFDRDHPLCELEPDIAEKIELYANNSQFHSGNRLLKDLPSPVYWADTHARLSGSFIISRLGGDRLSDLIDITTYRRNPENSRAIARMNHIWTERIGSFAAYCRLKAIDPLRFEGEDRARIYRALCWRCLSFEDVMQAEVLTEKAYEVDPRDETYWYAKACITNTDENYDLAKESAQRSLEADSLYLPSRYLLARVHEREGNTEQVEALLREGLTLHHDGHLAIQLLRMMRELDRYEDALELAHEVERCMPLRDSKFTQWLHGEYADIYYDLGRYEEAREHAAQGNEHYYKKFAERLGAMQGAPQKKRLPVSSVRQQRRTCGPATLASIARYWGKPVEQSEIIEEIWHDGTFDWKERRWAEDQGFVVREFRVTWECTQQLIDAGYPFAVMTAGADYSHLQAIIGYDAVRECVEVREPGSSTHVDYIQDKFFENNGWVGPRGLVFAPAEEAEALRALELPDDALYDLCYAMNRALEGHDRGRVIQIFAQLQETAPDSFLTHSASRLIANYDADTPRGLDAVRALRKEFPKATRLQLAELSYMRTENTWGECVDFLQELTKEKEVHPTVRMELGRLLMDDVRRSGEAEKVLWKCQSQHAGSSAVIQSLADLLWGRRERETAFEAYRFAFTQDYLNEGRARAFFQAARFFKRGEESLELLRQRVERHGKSSGEPAITLADMLRLIDRDQESMEVFEEATQKRPEDYALLTAFASRCIDWRQLDRAGELLERAKGKVHETEWLELSARLATSRGDYETAHDLYAEAVARNERNVVLQRAYTTAMHRIHGVSHVVEYLEKLCQRYPYNNELNELYISWLKDVDAVQGEMACRRLLEFHPNNHWARRELAIALENQGKISEAVVIAEAGRDNDKMAPASYTVLGDLYEKDIRFAEAAKCYQRAIELDVDNRFAISRLCALANNHAETAEFLDFVWKQIQTQTVFGDSLLEFRNQAIDVIPADDLLARLQDALSERHDLWHCHAVICYQLLDMNRIDEACEVAERCCERFPLVPGSFANLARIASYQGDLAKEIEGLEKALELNPHWLEIIERLIDAYGLANRGEDERELIERSQRLLPNAHTLHGYLAAWHARRSDTQTAIAELEKALSLEPNYPYGWSRLNEWGSHEECVKLAREIAEDRPGQANVWLMLAHVLTKEDERPEREAALQKAVELEPWNLDFVDELAQHYAAVGDYEKALLVASPESHREAMPFPMKGRQAWIIWESGKHDEAIRLMQDILSANPSYWWGTARLSEWYSAEKRFDEALELAETMTTRWPRNHVSWGFKGKVFGDLKRTKEAVESLKQALTLEADYHWAWDTIENLAARDEMEALALEMAERCPGQSHPWMMLARAMDEQNKINECLNAIDEALRRDARLIEAIDYKAVLLTRAGRFDEAREVCMPSAFGDNPPFNLLGRRAWVLAQEGKLQEGLNEMKEIWSQHPEYYWGGELVLTWLRELERWSDLSREAERFSQQFPDEAMGKGYGAIAADEKGNFGDAKRLLREALEIDEGYLFAANRLFYLHYDSQETIKAEEVSNRYSETLGEVRTMLFDALIAVQRGRWKDLKPLLPKLAVESDLEREQLRYLYERMKARSRGGMLIKVFSRMARSGEISEVSLRVLVEIKVEKRQLNITQLIENVSDERRVGALQTYFYQVSNGNLTTRQLNRIYKKYAELGRADNVAWGNIGRCLIEVRRYHEAVQWLSDWRERDIELWMLNNLLFAHIALGDWQAADEVAAAQVNNRSIQFGSDHPFGYLALRTAQAGDYQQSEALLRCVANDNADYLRILTNSGARLLIGLQEDIDPVVRKNRTRNRLKEIYNQSSDDGWSRPEAANLMRLVMEAIRANEPKAVSFVDGYYVWMIRVRHVLWKINYTG
ncbi:C39 family peptidase [Cerasicoccus fimbriatus]|uniref:C39 family peptidase n=1 Tax=Cerasicoccus fimbriatus TaxID=3014554 RepID=UPI0022B4F920|nr:C39 family peptidase [Cerasicoccus sp. TK19100]